MQNLILMLVALLPIIIFGTLISNLLIVGDSKAEKIALGYILGLGIFTFFLFLGNLVGLSYSLVNSALVLLVLITLALIANIVLGKLGGLEIKLSLKSLFVRFSEMSGFEKIALTIIALLAVFSIVSNLYWPIKEWDAVALYDFRARVFLQTGFMKEAASLGYFIGYPLLTSLAHMWAYLVGAGNPKLIYSFYYLSLLVLFYFLSRKAGLRRTPALIFTLLLSATGTIFEHSRFAYTNLPYSIYLFLGSAYSYLWIKKGNSEYLIISALLIVLSTWTRFAEPFWLPIILFVFVYALIKRKILAAIFYPLSVILFRYPWRLFVKSLGAGDPATEQGVGEMFKSIGTSSNKEQISSVLGYLWSNVVFKNLLLILLFFCVLITIPKIFKERNYPLMYLIFLIAAGFAILVFGTWMYSLAQPYWQEIGDSANRMMMFLTPLILFCVSLEVKNLK